MVTPHLESRMPTATTPIPQSKKQVTANLLAEGLASRVQWKTLIEAAHATWPQISIAQLAGSEGNIHALGGLIQLHHRLSREESDRQVKTFLAAQRASSNTTAPTL